MIFLELEPGTRACEPVTRSQTWSGREPEVRSDSHSRRGFSPSCAAPPGSRRDWLPRNKYFYIVGAFISYNLNVCNSCWQFGIILYLFLWMQKMYGGCNLSVVLHLIILIVTLIFYFFCHVYFIFSAWYSQTRYNDGCIHSVCSKHFGHHLLHPFLLVTCMLL